LNPRKVISVIGFDYWYGGAPFDKCARARKDKWKGTEDLDFIFFDCIKGVVSKIQLQKGAFSSEKKDEDAYGDFKKPEKDQFTFLPNPHDPARRVGCLKDEQYNLISAEYIYRYIERIGSGMAEKSILEFNIFSHAYILGPIIYNSDENYFIDTDFRAKHFSDPGIVNFEKFMNAFHPDGIINIWGCDFEPSVRNFFEYVFKNSSYKNSGLNSSDILSFQKNEYFSKFVILVRINIDTDNPGVSVSLASSGRLEFKHIMTIALKILKLSFAYSISKQTKRKTFAALPGTGADYRPDEKGMFVSLNGINSQIIKFYSEYLKIRLDKEGNNYADFS